MKAQPGFIPPFQDLATLSAHICTGASTIENWVRMGLFPKPRKIGGRNLWCWREVERHLTGDIEAQPTTADILAKITNGTRAAVQGRRP